MTHGSQQLRIFRRALRDGASVEQACAASGIPPDEARIHIAQDAKSPPPPEAFELIGTHQQKEDDMAKAQKEDGEGAGISGEYHAPDAKKAIALYRSDIAPVKAMLAEKRGDMSDPWKIIKEQFNFPKKILNLLFDLDGMEDSKRDHYLIALHLGLEEMKMTVPQDLVSMATGEGGGSIVGSGDKKKPRLATLQGKPTEDDFDEADEEELAGQKARPSTEKAKADAEAAEEAKAIKPKPGTAAAAMADMKGEPATVQ